jgi:hypothetical protein
MGFLAPAFLLGLLALAVPVALHLVRRERRQTVPFPSLMFLRRVPLRSVRRQKIRHWLLLAVRCAALALLALAFARPVFDAGPVSASAPGVGATARVVLVDRSYSMGYGDRWERALAAARDAVEGFGSEDPASVVMFAEDAEASGALSRDRALLVSSLDSARLSFERTRFAPALKLAARMLEDSPLPRRELTIVSDFQRRGADGLDDVQLPRGTEVTWVDLSEAEAGNLGVTDLTLRRVYEQGRERVAVSARVVSQGTREGAPRDVPVTLELDGRDAQTVSVALAGNGSASASFEPVSLPQGTLRGAVRVAGDALPQDDVYRFVLSPSQELGVLVLERAEARPGQSLYLRRALAIGDRPRFRVSVERGAAPSAEQLARFRVVVLNDAPWPAGAAGRALGEFLRVGGGVVAALGPRAGLEGAELQGVTQGEVVDRSADWGGTLAHLDYDHPSLALFRSPRSGDFSQARFLRYRKLELASGSPLARFDDGSPALVEAALGSGRALIWASSLDTLWNDLPLQPVFLPFLHRLLTHAAGYEEQPVARRVRDVVALRPEQASWVGEAPSGARLEPGSGLIELRESGFYELRAPGGGPTETLAVNVDPAESDLTPVDPEELAGSLSRPAGETGVPSGLSSEEREDRQRLWWFVLAAALAALAADTGLSNRLSGEVR